MFCAALASRLCARLTPQVNQRAGRLITPITSVWSRSSSAGEPPAQRYARPKAPARLAPARPTCQSLIAA